MVNTNQSATNPNDGCVKQGCFWGLELLTLLLDKVFHTGEQLGGYAGEGCSVILIGLISLLFSGVKFLLSLFVDAVKFILSFLFSN